MEAEAAPTSPPKKKAKAKKTTAPAATEGDYADYYKRIRTMAKDKGMKEDSIMLLLKDRSKGESAYRTVSSQKIFKKSWFYIEIEFYRNSPIQVMYWEFFRLGLFFQKMIQILI